MSKGVRMKLYLITINDLHNYGNRLQNYATQHFLYNESYEVENIVDTSYYPILEKNAKWKIITALVFILRKFKRDIGINRIRENNFLFFNKLIKYSGISVGTSEELKNQPITDCMIIIGSDQVWNPKFAMSDITLLKDINCLRKISFSSSFGVNQLQYDETIASCLSDFYMLSVREEAGAKIIKEMTGREAEVLIDPTMMLTCDDWRKVSRKPKGAKLGYVLTYFLSDKSNEAKEGLKEVKEDRHVYELLNTDDPVAGVAGPSEFLWLIDHADIILTDSFHACVFSFLFNKPFIVYDRNWSECNMNSRLETLLDKFDLKRKYANSNLENDIWEHDYSIGYKQLVIERRRASEFLNRALKNL